MNLPTSTLWAAALALAACSKTPTEPASGSPSDSSSSAASQPTTVASAAPATSAALASTLRPDLLDPSKATAKAPDVFKAKFTTTKGSFVIEVHREWSPNGADRFYNLVKMGFFDDTRFFRAIDGFMVQFGLSGDPAVSSKWQDRNIADDPVKQSNKRGFATFAQKGTPNTRATQVFINYGDNSRLDSTFEPFGKVSEGMEIVDSLYKGYGEGAPMGGGPDQGRIQALGNAYLDSKFPKLDGVQHAEIVP